MRWIPTPDAYRLLHEGQIALSEIENNGCRVDKDYVERGHRETQARIRELEADLRKEPVYAIWRRRFGEKTNVASPDQLASIVFGEMGYRPTVDTKGRRWGDRQGDADGRASASEAALEAVPEPFLKRLYLPAQKLRKANGTYLGGLLREMVQHADGNWYVHPNYNLNTVETFRSSASDPNYTNVPTRNQEIGELVRRAYISRPGFQLGELDYGQIEVRIPCCYNFDPTLIEYVCDPAKDMHRDMAAQIFLLDNPRVSKELRSHVKNKVVFPTFYGSYYAQIAPSLWEALERFGLTVEGVKKADGTPLTVREHLAANGIRELGACDPEQEPKPGTFEHHLKVIEEDFWGRRFAVYSRWKKDWIAAYYRDGGCRFLTGFVMRGPHKRNDITNYCVQGVAFHCLLWSLVKIVRILRKYKFRSVVIGEVHDSINLDVHPAERDDVFHLCSRVMTEDIKVWAPWLNVPLVAEAEVCPIDGSWFEKAALKEEGGRFVPANRKKWDEKYGPWESQIVG
jgi:DNA polymerase I-like protein with 3'-5' exonuclease and polymerase domains